MQLIPENKFPIIMKTDLKIITNPEKNEIALVSFEASTNETHLIMKTLLAVVQQTMHYCSRAKEMKKDPFPILKFQNTEIHVGTCIRISKY